MVTRVLRAAIAVASAVGLLVMAPAARAEPGPEHVSPSGPRIPAGREEQVLAVVRRAMTDARVEVGWDVAIDRGVFEVRLHDGRTLVVAAPGAGQTPAGAPDRVALRCAGECSPTQRDASAALASALAAQSEGAAASIWVRTPVSPAASGSLGQVAGTARWWHPARLAFFGGVLLASAIAGRGLMRWRPGRWAGALALVVVAAVGLSLVGAWGTLHEHNTFALRLDCAYALTCTEDPRAPGWGPAYFLTYGPLLHLLPYTVEAPVHLSRAFAALSLVLLGALVRDLASATTSPRFADAAGLAAAATLGLNPVSSRLAASDSPWPFVVACLLAAALLARRALRQGSGVAALSAGALLIPVLGGNLALGALWPAVLVAPLAWARSPSPLGAVRAALALALPAAVTVPELVTRLRATPAAGATLERALHVPHFLALDFRFASPVFVVALMAAGVWLASERTRGSLWDASRTWLPVLLLLVAHPALDVYGGPLGGYSHPVGALNHHLSMVVTAALAGVGLAEVGRRAAGWGRPAMVGIGGATLLAWAAPTDGWDLWRRHHAPSAEAAALARELPRLPPHDTLVVASAMQPRLAETVEGDPIEVHYPVGAHRAAARRRGEREPVFLTIPELLAGTPRPRALVYVGTSLRSFKPAERAAGAVPESLERPELGALREHYRLEPAVTFELPTAQSRFVTMRLGADQVPTITLGYYWATPRH